MYNKNEITKIMVLIYNISFKKLNHYLIRKHPPPPTIR
jgi:hypothetical protein